MLSEATPPSPTKGSPSEPSPLPSSSVSYSSAEACLFQLVCLLLTLLWSMECARDGGFRDFRPSSAKRRYLNFDRKEKQYKKVIGNYGIDSITTFTHTALTIRNFS